MCEIYESQKYNCISVDDDLVSMLSENLSIMKTYFHSFTRPEYGLAMTGITIIPPESLPLFYEIVSSSKYELSELAQTILQAIEVKKHIIHFGV